MRHPDPLILQFIAKRKLHQNIPTSNMPHNQNEALYMSITDISCFYSNAVLLIYYLYYHLSKNKIIIIKLPYLNDFDQIALMRPILLFIIYCNTLD